MEANNILTIIACIFLILILGLVLKIKIWKLLKFIINSFLGAILIYIINLVGVSFDIHIGLNLVTSMLVGILGIPGAILLLLLKIF